MGLDNSDEDEDDMHVEDTEPAPPRMTEVIDCLEDIRSFLEQNSYAEEATRTDELLSAVTRLKCTCSVQDQLQILFLNYAVSVLYCHNTCTVKIHLPSLYYILIVMIKSSNP